MSDAIEFVRPAALTGVLPYAPAAVTGPGRTVFTAGACPLDAHGATVAVGDVAGQARQVMADLVTTLAAAGAALTDVVKTTVYVASADRADLPRRGTSSGLRSVTTMPRAPWSASPCWDTPTSWSRWRRSR